MNFKRKSTVFMIAIDTMFILFFIGGIILALWHTYQTGVNKFFKVEYYVPLWLLLQLGIFPFAHGGYKKLFTPSISINPDELIIRNRLKTYKVPYGKIRQIDIDKTVYLYFLDNKQHEQGIYLDLQSEQYTEFKNAIVQKNSKINVTDLRN